MIYQEQHFTHHGMSFVIEADGWPTEEMAEASMIDLQSWAMALDPLRTAALHAALASERQALVHDLAYDMDQVSLKEVRQAQRRAVQSGLGGNPTGLDPPTIMLEVCEDN